LKNMFGLIPDPIRRCWHGPKNVRMNPSVIGVSKLYGSLFDVVGAHESLGGTPVAHPEGEITVPGFRYNLHEELGCVSQELYAECRGCAGEWLPPMAKS